MICSSDKKRRSKGVTLLEMLIVLSIISISAVIFGVMTMNGVERGRAVRQAELLASAIRSARADAIAGGRQMDITFRAAERAYSFQGREIVYLPTGVAMEFTGASELFDESGAGLLRIYADGSTSGALIKISSTREADLIAVDWLTGAVRLSRERR